MENDTLNNINIETDMEELYKYNVCGIYSSEYDDSDEEDTDEKDADEQEEI